MILVGIVYAAFTGNMAAVTDAALSSAGEEVSLCITMSVYFLAAKVTKTRYTLAGALFSSFVGLIASVILTGWIC